MLCPSALNFYIVLFDCSQILRHQMKNDAATYISSLTAAEDSTPGGSGPASRRAAATAVKGGAGGGSARLRRQTATTGGKLRGSRMARPKQVLHLCNLPSKDLSRVYAGSNCEIGCLLFDACRNSSQLVDAS